MKKKSKRIELSENCIKKISILAIKNNTVFKLYVENLLENSVKDGTRKY